MDILLHKYMSIIQKYWYFFKVSFKREITNLDRPCRRSAVFLAALRALASLTAATRSCLVLSCVGDYVSVTVWYDEMV